MPNPPPARVSPHAVRLPLSVALIVAGTLLFGAATLGGDETAARSADPIAALAPGIVGSAHDFSARGRVPADLCLPCHTPHITAAEAPLMLTAAAAGGSTRSYQTRAGELDAASLVCLSCHDGSVARDVYAGTHAMTWSDGSAGGVGPGRTRVVNHPVGVRYPDGRSDYRSAAAVAASGLALPNGRIQCTTCHDPHNTHRHPGMLVISNDRSRLCLSCHRL